MYIHAEGFRYIMKAKRIISLLIVMVLVLTLLPVVALALENYTMDFSEINTVNWSGSPVNYSSADASGSGWNWEWATKTLTLSGLNFETTQPVAIKLPAGATILLAGSTTSIVKSGTPIDNSTHSNGISCIGALTIEGGGTLRVTGGDLPANSTARTSGIGASNGLTIESGTIHAIGGTSDSNTATGAGIWSESFICINGGTVNATSNNVKFANFAIYSTSNDKDITINDGTVTVTATNNSAEYCRGILTATRSVIINGGTVIANVSSQDRAQGIFAKDISITNGTVTATVTNSGSSGASSFRGLYAFNGIAISGGTVKAFALGAAQKSYGMESDTILCKITGGTVYATGFNSAMPDNVPAPTGLTITGSTTTNAAENTLGAVILDGTSKNYYMGSVAPANVAKTLKLVVAAPIHVDIALSPVTTFPQGNAPSNMVINVGSTGQTPSTGHFSNLEISPDGNSFTTVNQAYYSVAYGSIHIALNQSWLNTLTPGAYTLRVNLAGAYAGMQRSTQLIVTAPGSAGNAEVDIPKTGDSAMPGLWIGLMLLSMAGLWGSVITKRKRKEHAAKS